MVTRQRLRLTGSVAAALDARGAGVPAVAANTGGTINVIVNYRGAPGTQPLARQRPDTQTPSRKPAEPSATGSGSSTP